MQEYYSYSNDIGCFVYYNCPQLNEEEFYVTVYKEKNIKIDWLLEYPKEITSFKKRIKGIKYLLKNWRKDYWELIASLIKKEIQEKNSLFGLRIDKKCF